MINDYRWMIASLIIWQLCLNACSSNQEIEREPFRQHFFSGDVRVWALDSSPYQDKLEDCVYRNEPDKACSYLTLPPLGQEEVLDRTAIEARVVASDPWLRAQFVSFMDRVPESLWPLFAPVTAIVLSRNLSHSFFWALNGVLYLDANLFWQELEESYQVPVKSRLHNGFAGYSYYLEVVRTPEISGDLPRTEDEIWPNFASELFHQLAHANDFMGTDMSAAYAGITPYQLAVNRMDQRLHDGLGITLNAPTLTALARNIVYQEYSSLLLGVDVETVESLWQESEATHFLSFLSPEEDFAYLVQSLILDQYLDVEEQIYLVPKGQELDENGLVGIAWGASRWVRNEDVFRRAQIALSSILGDDSQGDGIPSQEAEIFSKDTRVPAIRP
ncbi:hypothetical protein [Pseudobacteriovorax antillogorgiicola]|uniref:Uncharacterized protein n=1 Tax=Pseudobacteriovorax antillogorgiicola TaxID=1513793 RepID=A0A1Y6CJ33_9BACT|nr:hypothetical protein [Pseudobacteriovorax antillogorgiicola]TCS47030.1 hypothetical protein EDD56_122125 [Pseudobacteriovorax antillogorgiicola]SMF65289.1 hypothetical protein SAMN06296036_122125 [Pseudobacteriovorax antillogorgiicola]